MSLLDQLTWSLRHVRRQFLESLLVILAIGLGIGVIVTVLAMFWSVGEEYSRIGRMDYFRTLEIVGRNDSIRWQSDVPLAVVGAETESSGWSVTLDEILEFQNYLPAGMHAYVELGWLASTGLLPVEEGSEEEWIGFQGNEIFLSGTVPAFFAFKQAKLARGNLFLLDDVAASSRVLILTEGLARDLFGEEDPLGKTVPLNLNEGEEENFTVIGVLAAPPQTDSYSVFRDNRTAFVPISVIPAYRWGGEEVIHFSSVSVGLDEGVDLVWAVEYVRSEAELRWGSGATTLRNPLDDWRESMRQMQRYALLIGMLASVGLVIAVINILNLMLARLLKRTKTIGISLALGSSRRLVFRQFMLEAVVLGLAGAVLGIGLSAGFAKLLGRGFGGFASGSVGLRIGLGLGLGVLVSILFGVYPAFLGSRVNPVDALRVD